VFQTLFLNLKTFIYVESIADAAERVHYSLHHIPESFPNYRYDSLRLTHMNAVCSPH
jgi:hypothetical protein